MTKEKQVQIFYLVANIANIKQINTAICHYTKNNVMITLAYWVEVTLML